MARVIVVERGVVGAEDAERLAKCLAVRECSVLRSFRGDAREIEIYDAPSTDRVRESYRSAGVTFERAWPADESPAVAP